MSLKIRSLHAMRDPLNTTCYPRQCVVAFRPDTPHCCYGRFQYQALRFLHGYRIVHKNIKSPNVLLDRRGKAKLSDISLADISASINGDTGGGYHSNVTSTVSIKQF